MEALLRTELRGGHRRAFFCTVLVNNAVAKETLKNLTHAGFHVVTVRGMDPGQQHMQQKLGDYPHMFHARCAWTLFGLPINV